jgi:futalosine hydrolase
MHSGRKIHLLLAVPTGLEAVPLERAFPGREPGAFGGSLLTGEFGGLAAGLAVTGLGVVNTAMTLAVYIERLGPDAVILAGMGGAYPGAGAEIGDIAVATKEVYGELGLLTEDGWSPLDEIGIPSLSKDGKDFFNEFPVRPELAKRAAAAASKVAKVVSGPFVTVSQITGTAARAKELEERFNAACENMEGAAAAQVCLAAGIDFVEVRGVSNIVGVRDKSRWDVGAASQVAARASLALLGGWPSP